MYCNILNAQDSISLCHFILDFLAIVRLQTGWKQKMPSKALFLHYHKKVGLHKFTYFVWQRKNNPCILELNTDFFFKWKKSQLKQVLKFCTKTYNQINKFLKYGAKKSVSSIVIFVYKLLLATRTRKDLSETLKLMKN